jgi:hypothetical protein
VGGQLKIDLREVDWDGMEEEEEEEKKKGENCRVYKRLLLDPIMSHANERLIPPILSS